MLEVSPGRDLARRLEKLQARWNARREQEVVSALRAIEGLERLGTDAARAVLKEAQKGYLADEAKAALSRLGREAPAEISS